MKCWQLGTVSLQSFYMLRGSLDTLSLSRFNVQLNNSIMVSNSICGQHFLFNFFKLATCVSFKLKKGNEFCCSFTLNFPESEYIRRYNKKQELKIRREKCCRSLLNFVTSIHIFVTTIVDILLEVEFRFVSYYCLLSPFSVDPRKNL